MRHIYSIGLVLALAACAPSLKSEVSGNVLDYKEVETQLSDQMLLLNILRAKDGLPIHFSDLVNIHGSLQATAQIQAGFPFGPLNKSTSRDTLTPQVSVQTAPTFDLNSLDTQPFTNGIMSQIDPKAIKNVLDLGLDYRLALLLFFSGIQIGETGPVINNAPFDQTLFCTQKRTAADPDPIPEQVPIAERTAAETAGKVCSPAFFEYLSRMNEIKNFHVNVYRELRPLGAPFALSLQGNIKDIVGTDPAKYEIRSVDGGNSQLYVISPQAKIAFCFEPRAGVVQAATFADSTQSTTPSLIVDVKQACSGSGSDVVLPASPPPANDFAEKRKIIFRVRSPYAIAKYVGEILRYEEIPDEVKRDRCITLDGIDRSCASGNVLFYAKKDLRNAAVSVRVDQGSYGLRPSDSCFDTSRNPSTACDHSLDVLSALELLINLSKVATDLRVTPSVQLLP